MCFSFEKIRRLSPSVGLILGASGAYEGQTFALRGKGNYPKGGGVPGDLLVVIEEIKIVLTFYFE